MRKLFFAGVLILCAISISCSPITIKKCITDYKYDDGKVQSQYEECITQTPEKTPPIHLKHQELYE